MGQRVDANRTRNDLRHMFDLWRIEQFSIMREQEEYVSGGMKRGNGVTVSYFRKGEWQTVFCNHFDYSENMRSIFLFLNRVRIAEKTGVSYQGLSSTKDLVKSFSDAKPEVEEILDEAYDVVGCQERRPDDLIKRVYASKVKTYHPDVGGDPEKFKRLTAAYDLIWKSRGQK